MDGEIVEKEWPGIPLTELSLEPENTNEAKDEEEGVPENKSDEDENEQLVPTVSETIVSFSTRCTRVTDKARKRSYKQYLEGFKLNVEATKKKYNALLEEENFFSFNWDKRIKELRAQMSEGRFN